MEEEQSDGHVAKFDQGQDATATSGESVSRDVEQSLGRKEEWMHNTKVGLLAYYRPQIEKEVSRTRELVRSQQVLLDALQQEKTRVEEYALTDQLQDLFRDIKLYHGKLLNMKKDMTVIDEKVSRMVKKTNRLRILKQKEDMYKAQQEDKKRIMEKEITAKPAVDDKKQSS